MRNNVKIVAVTKTLNEERNIENFCRGYDFADAILVADGGSTDRTVELAQRFDNVEVRNFPLRIEMPGDPAGFMNPEPQHINFVIDWAIEEKADWICLDGADCWPNPRLRLEARTIVEEVTEPMIYVYRLYIWGQDQYFPKYNKSGQSLWAWRPEIVNIRSDEPRGRISCFNTPMVGMKGPRQTLKPPYVCLHYFCPDEETVQMKMARYAAWGYPQVHQLKSIYAPPEPLPEWVLKE